MSVKIHFKITVLIYFCFIDYAKAFDCVDHNKLWKIFEEMRIPDNLTCLLRNLYADQEATVRTGHGKTDWFQIGKEVHHGCILSPCLFNYMQSTSRETLGLKKHKLESRLPGEIWITSDMQMLLLLLSRFSRVRLCATSKTAAHQAPPSLGFSRQEHWSGLPFPSPMHKSEKWKWSHSVMSDS